jgi:serine/threonine protein kinase
MTSSTIGKFKIHSRLSRGGMADIYRCSLRGIGGFDKVVVVKRIRRERASDPEFVSMFLDEARLAANLNHPNIVQTFEINEVDGFPYIAMEYVAGPTLAMLVRAARRASKRPLAGSEVGHLAKILAGVCEGLHHAHTASSPAGEPLGLVHRDVSPENIIVSRDGVPKLLDFGVAKANGRLTETQAGTIKGKLRYIAPEQLSGSVDHRADVYAVGVCLFEATTGQSPYGTAAGDDLALIDSISHGRQARPSEVMADYPARLEEIVLWAMQPDPARRCPSASELHDCLERFVAQGPFLSNGRLVAAWVKELFPKLEVVGVADPGTDLRETVAEELTPSPPAPRSRPMVHLAWTAAAVALVAVAAVRWTPAAAPPPQAAAPGPAGHAAPPALPDRPLGRAPAGQLYGPPLEAMARTRQGWRSPRRPEARMAGQPLEQPAPVPFVHDEEGSNEPPNDGAEPTLTQAAPLGADDRPVEPPEEDDPTPEALAARDEDPGKYRDRNTERLVEQTPERIVPSAPAATPSPRPSAGAIYSVQPRSRVPRPGLPRTQLVQGQDDLLHILASVEEETLKAGCSPEFARGITAAAFTSLSNRRSPEIHPAAMYYFIVREAALGREKAAAAQSLRAAVESGLIRALIRLPVDERSRL